MDNQTMTVLAVLAVLFLWSRKGTAAPVLNPGTPLNNVVSTPIPSQGAVAPSGSDVAPPIQSTPIPAQPAVGIPSRLGPPDETVPTEGNSWIAPGWNVDASDARIVNPAVCGAYSSDANKLLCPLEAFDPAYWPQT